MFISGWIIWYCPTELFLFSRVILRVPAQHTHTHTRFPFRHALHTSDTRRPQLLLLLPCIIPRLVGVYPLYRYTCTYILLLLLLYYRKKHLFMLSSSPRPFRSTIIILRLHCGGGGSRFRKTVATNARKNGCLLACGRRRCRKGER